jgi:acetyl esterase/lipase
MKPTSLLATAVVAVVSIFFYGQFSQHYYPRANVATNLFHVLHKSLEKVLGAMHDISDNDTTRLTKARRTYELISLIEKRSQVDKNIFQVVANDGNQIPVASYRPKSCADRTCPAVIYYHGGGYTLGGIDMYEHITTVIAERTSAVVFFVDYRLGTSHKFNSHSK